MAFFQRDIWRYQLQDALIYWLYLPAAVIGSGMLLDRLLGFERVPSFGLLDAAAVCLVGLGGWLMQRSIVDLDRYGDGTPNPRRPPKRLVVHGVYRFCRHPMFLGYDLAALGVVLFLRSPAMLVFSFPLFLFLEIRYLRKEDKYLQRRYGESFRVYREKVPMLWPSLHSGGK